jgi:putative Mg2+ transporter-C (MgtC) family protein
LRDGFHVRGLNTAATLWCSAAVGVLAGAGHFVPALAGTVVVLATNTLLRRLSYMINAAPVGNADLVREYQIAVICRADDEIHIRTQLSNTLYAKPLSFQSLTSEDLPDDSARMLVTATLRLHPKDQQRLEQVAARISMEKSVSSVSWSGKDAEPLME